MKITTNELAITIAEVKKIKKYFHKMIKPKSFLFFPINVEECKTNQDDLIILTENKNKFGYSNMTIPGILLYYNSDYSEKPILDRPILAYVNTDCQANIDLVAFAEIEKALAANDTERNEINEAFNFLKNKDAMLVKADAIIAKFSLD